MSKKDLEGDKDNVQVSKDTVPVQDPTQIGEDKPKASEVLKSESNPTESPALSKDEAKLIANAPVEPSRSDTVLKDAGQWPTEAHRLTTRRAFSDGPDSIHPEQSPPPKDPQRTQTIKIEAPEGAKVTRA